MSIQTRLLTYDDLCRMPDDGQRYEIIGGELIVSPAPNRDHQDVAYRLTRLIGDKVDAEKLGSVRFAPIDVRLSPTDVVQPDLLYIRRDRIHIYHARGDVQGPPDLVVEIISPSSEKTDPGRKFDLYASSGVPEYWLVDPATRRFQLFVLREGRYEESTAKDGGLRSEVIPGLVVDPAALFAALDQD
ncbi:MAG: Uma2 family endonuclease [Chloroflexia bacterium]|nr:Uma2 family endonuclease [Chloroflexia bacterium]